MSTTAQLRDSDVHAMIRLAGEIGEVSRDSGRRIVHLLDGLRPLVGVRIAAWFVNKTGANGRSRLHAVVDRGWDSQHERDAYARYISADLTRDPLYDPFEHWCRSGEGASANSLVLNWRDHLTADAYDRHPYVQELLRPNGLDEQLVFCRRTDRPGTTVGLALFREQGDTRPFTPRDRALIDLMYTSCASLIDDAIPLPSLSPRAAQVLDCLLEGDSIKQVAGRLRLSPHTVNDHVKSIYKRYKVTSRAELLAKFVRARPPFSPG